MAELIKKHIRAKQIIQLLMTHGPLSFRALQRMIEPYIKKRRLLDSLKRLQRRGFVDRRFERLFGGKGIFYNLSQYDESLAELSNYMGVPLEKLRQPHFRQKELLHSECCALWAHALKKLFPEVEIIRDFEFKNSFKAEKIMLTSIEDLDLHPDLLLIFPEGEGHNEIAIAVEIERSFKTIKRLRQKLKKYANGTHVDGVVYLCDTQYIANSISKVYESKPLQTSKRIGHYSENFLLFGDSASIHTKKFLEMFNSRLKGVFLPQWVMYLRDTRLNSRRDSNFQMSAPRCWHDEQVTKN